MQSMNEPVSGAYALARGAIEAGVSLVTGYPGAPATAVVNKILALTSPDEIQVEWTSSEKVTIEMAFGLHPDHPLLLCWLVEERRLLAEFGDAYRDYQ
jgi:TPP-dependent indolepyruvate ferredoxin oxidoreductase alpha subunit